MASLLIPGPVEPCGGVSRTEPECPFCGDPLVVHVEPSEDGADIVGDCRRCNETVAVEQ